ncbi:preprotein translocase subunit SecE [Actinophytocola xinjiangensis]|uniref:Protein translocase subunit SecE n=1 Tax=Actinophytocola xinjiangensis TaxID=485602 RepID=A0A7Z0WNQ5_9PSEU|nr:preprotein translocase subunit SecE [Actinophytocola xinjiangensis]OLF11009.1 preprotein translocase subunit SecE [Actinophytocola xinjiangensis]
MVDDRDKERDKGQERPSRPVTAAARRERRASARPAARKDASADDAKSAKADDKAGDKRPRAKSKSAQSKTGEHKGRPTPTRDRKESPGFFARIFRFLREVVAELRKVIWPTRKQMITYTAVVLVFVAFMVALIAGLDLALGQGVSALFG